MAYNLQYWSQDASLFLHKNLRSTQPLLQVFRVPTQTVPAVNVHPTKLHVISMTTAPESQFDSLLLRSPLMCRAAVRVRGWSAVRQYFLSSHGQLADRLVRPLLAQHTTMRGKIVLYAMTPLWAVYLDICASLSLQSI